MKKVRKHLIVYKFYSFQLLIFKEAYWNIFCFSNETRLLWVCVLLRLEPRALWMVGKCSTAELQPPAQSYLNLAQEPSKTYSASSWDISLSSMSLFSFSFSTSRCKASLLVPSAWPDLGDGRWGAEKAISWLGIHNQSLGEVPRQSLLTSACDTLWPPRPQNIPSCLEWGCWGYTAILGEEAEATWAGIGGTCL